MKLTIHWEKGGTQENNGIIDGGKQYNGSFKCTDFINTYINTLPRYISLRRHFQKTIKVTLHPAKNTNSVSTIFYYNS